MIRLRDNIKIVAGALVCADTDLKGEITIGAGTIIHPGVTISALGGPIIIGENCLIEEQSKIINKAPIGAKETDPVPVLLIGNNNVFEVDSFVEAVKIGDNNVFESKCYVGNQVTISNGCVIGAGCKVSSNEILPENTIIYGQQCKRRLGLDRPTPQTLQLETLTKILPNYHLLKRASKKGHNVS